MEIEKQTYNQLITEIGSLLQQGRQQAVPSVGNYFKFGCFLLIFQKSRHCLDNCKEVTDYSIN